jgi:hypothetical protein
MTDEHATRPIPHEPTCFNPGEGTHPARQSWLLAELEQWFAGDLPDGGERRRIVGRALRHATEDARRWLDSRCDGDDLVRVDLHLSGPRGDRHSVFTEVPSPLTLLLTCLDQCRMGDEVRLVQELAKRGRVESSATWPFGMDETETLTRPMHLAVEPAAG